MHQGQNFRVRYSTQDEERLPELSRDELGDRTQNEFAHFVLRPISRLAFTLGREMFQHLDYGLFQFLFVLFGFVGK